MPDDRPKTPFLRQSGPQFMGPDNQMVRPRAFMHYCQHPGCEEWGAFGFGVNLRAKIPTPGRWYCAKHKADGLNQKSTSGVDDAPEVKNEPKISD